jgi:hypothetical protein
MRKSNQKGEERQVVEEFDVFTPIALANIHGVDEVLSDRCITTILEKSSQPYMILKIEDFSQNALLSLIKAKLGQIHVWLCNVWLVEKCIEEWNNHVESCYNHTSIHTLHTIHNYTQPYIDSYVSTGDSKTLFDKEEFFNRIIKTNLQGRNIELFFPLLLTSDLIGDEVFEDFLKIATTLGQMKKEDEFIESRDVSLIEFVAQCERYRFEMVYANQLKQEFQEFSGASAQDLEKWLTPEWLGLALKRLKLVKSKKRVVKGVLIHLDIDKAKEKIKMFKPIITHETK